MKRLKNIILSLQQNETTYKQLYDGKIHMLAEIGSNDPPINLSEPVYWENEIFYKYERTNRIEHSKPTVIIGIPIRKLRIMEGFINGDSKLSHSSIPAADYCLRRFQIYVNELNERLTNKKRTEKENGRYYLYEPNGKVLKRNCSYFKLITSKYYVNTGKQSGRMIKNAKDEWYLNLMIMIQLPDKKVKQTFQMLTKDLPTAVNHYIQEFNCNEMKKAIVLYHKQESIRKWLSQSDYCAFIADGSILPRDKDTDLPMKKARPFSSSYTNRIQIGELTGMGMKRGVTVITGGGYSGKSTLLDAVSNGIYNHIAGDGREFVITDKTAMKISAEDGRSIRNLNISAFIQWIPGADTTNFSTSHASGSTSQAANIMEAVNDGCKLLLIDEDKSATNFMIRDEYMQRLVDHDPIIPFTDRVQELFGSQKVSTILVIGGSSEYLKVSDNIIMMKNYLPSDITKQAKQLVYDKYRKKASLSKALWKCASMTTISHFTPYSNKYGLSEHLEISEKGFLEIGDECIDVRMLHNIADTAQLTAIAFLLRKIENATCDKHLNLKEIVETYLQRLENGEMDEIYSTYFTKCQRWLELPRSLEVLAILHRMRNL